MKTANSFEFDNAVLGVELIVSYFCYRILRSIRRTLNPFFLKIDRTSFQAVRLNYESGRGLYF